MFWQFKHRLGLRNIFQEQMKELQEHAQLTQKKILDNIAQHLKSKNDVNRPD